MSGKYVRLQEPITFPAGSTQDKREAVDVGNYGTVIVQVNRLVAAVTAGNLVMEHAAVREDNQFEPIGGTISLASTGPISVTLTGHSRFLRWNTSGITGATPPVASVDLVMRDS